MNPDDGGIGSRADSAIAVARETPGMVAMCVGCVGGGGGVRVVEHAKALIETSDSARPTERPIDREVNV